MSINIETLALAKKYTDGKFYEGGSGEAGEDGATFIPSVSEDGIISWTNDKNLPNPSPVNIKGEKGDNGIAGIDGKTPVKGIDYWTEEDKQEILQQIKLYWSD